MYVNTDGMCMTVQMGSIKKFIKMINIQLWYIMEYYAENGIEEHLMFNYESTF